MFHGKMSTISNMANISNGQYISQSNCKSDRGFIGSVNWTFVDRLIFFLTLYPVLVLHSHRKLFS